MNNNIKHTDNPSLWQKFWSKFFTMFYEDDSEWWSSIRFGFIYMMLLSNFCVWLTWVTICVIKGEIVSIPESILGLYAIANGIGFGSKVRQKGKELNFSSIVDGFKNKEKTKEEENSNEGKQ